VLDLYREQGTRAVEARVQQRIEEGFPSIEILRTLLYQ
jgi:hypothetical protein